MGKRVVVGGVWARGIRGLGVKMVVGEMSLSPVKGLNFKFGS